VLRGELAAEERAFDVDGDDGVDLVVGRLGDRSERRDSGVVDEDVDGAEGAACPLDQAGEPLAAADVRFERDGGAARLDDGPEDRNGTRNFDEIRFWPTTSRPGGAATSTTTRAPSAG
jgi:hypothetical protein